VIGTTNRADILDKAIVRPGRFDRHVVVPLPDVRGRLKILQTHAQRLPAEADQPQRLTAREKPSSNDGPGITDWYAWAKRTSGFSGADLAGLINEAAMAAAREGARGVGERHVQAAYDKALIGIPSGRHPSAAQQKLTAAHEAGHAVVNEAMRAAISLDGFRTVAHISIVPAGSSGGVTQFAAPEDGRGVPESRRVLVAYLAVAMGGRAAEELHNGQGGATMGARADFEDATRLATDMVTRGGLAEQVGPRSFAVGSPSEDLRRVADEEVNKLLTTALSAARRSLAENRALHQAVADALMDHETMDAAAFQRLVAEHHVKAITV